MCSYHVVDSSIHSIDMTGTVHGHTQMMNTLEPEGPFGPGVCREKRDNLTGLLRPNWLQAGALFRVHGWMLLDLQFWSRLGDKDLRRS
jgi:hypothetical protein